MNDLDGMGEQWFVVLYHFQNQFALVALLAGFLISFLLAFAVGANDSANSWGTSVGAGTVSLGWAYILGSVMEIIGATLLSGDVIQKVAFGIVDMDFYRSNRTEVLMTWNSESRVTDLLGKERILMLGCISVMLGSGVWQLVASWLSWPVAGTHCIIFGLLGFTVAAEGPSSIKNPGNLLVTILYMFLSILASTVVTAAIYYPLYKWCIRSKDPHSSTNRMVFSVMGGLAVGIPVAFILAQVEKAWHSPLNILASLTTSYAYSAFLAIGLLVAMMVALLAYHHLIPRLVNMEGDFALDFTISCPSITTCYASGAAKSTEQPQGDQLQKAVEGDQDKADSSTATESNILKDHSSVDVGKNSTIEEDGDDTDEIKRIFRPMQVVSACTSALAHGGNDVANCIGPFVIIWIVFRDGILDVTTAEADSFLALWGGLGISLGLIFYGERVIQTMGSNISRMTPSRGFCVEWAASLTILLFTVCGVPLSTTHCKVGGLIGAGLTRGLVETGSLSSSFRFVNFHVLSGVLLSWVLTVPAAFSLSAAIFLILDKILL